MTSENITSLTLRLNDEIFIADKIVFHSLFDTLLQHLNWEKILVLPWNTDRQAQQPIIVYSIANYRLRFNLTPES